MASIRIRKKLDGSQTYTVMWRDPATKRQQGLTLTSLGEAETIKRLLDANGQSFVIAQDSLLRAQSKVPTVAAVIQEHINLMVRPASGTIRNYQTMLDLHIKPVLGATRDCPDFA